MSFDLLKSADVLIGVILGLCALVSGAFVLLDRRSRRLLSDQTRPLEMQGHEVIGRVEQIERQVGGLDRDVDHLRGRMSEMEKGIALLATKSDLAGVSHEVAALSATVRETSNKVDTIYRAALDNGARKGRA
ncbi:MAG: hypothetical protein ACU0BF_09145 [Paracoccaceae bacterium]